MHEQWIHYFPFLPLVMQAFKACADGFLNTLHLCYNITSYSFFFKSSVCSYFILVGFQFQEWCEDWSCFHTFCLWAYCSEHEQRDVTKSEAETFFGSNATVLVTFITRFLTTCDSVSHKLHKPGYHMQANPLPYSKSPDSTNLPA